MSQTPTIATLPAEPRRLPATARFVPSARMRTLTLPTRPPALRARRRSLIDIDLDPAQRAAAQSPPGGAMLVLGEAGHGKTTVALHRLAHLYRTARGRFRAAVIVPHEGLTGLLQPLVTRLGADVNVVTYAEWARDQARRAFPDIPHRESQSVPEAVLRLKRAPQLRELLQELAQAPPGLIDEDEDAPEVVTRAHAQRGDLQHLFGDRERMRRLAQAAGLPERSVAAVLEHTRVQFQQRSEDAYADVDSERRLSVDRLALDAGTPAENSATLDSEDYAVLFELDRLRARATGVRPTRPRAYDCIVLDEAQEFAELELALIGRSLARGGTLVVAGDADQQTDPSAGFTGWENSMRALGACRHATVLLEVGYRCPAEVVTFARALRAGGLPPPCVPLVQFADERQLTAWLAREAAQIEERDPSASFCIVCRKRELATRIAAALRGKVACKLVLDEEFVFHRGVDVTTLENVKGLEFDYMIVADADQANYPDSADARRALYVASTRARFQLVLACSADPSPLLARFVAGG